MANRTRFSIAEGVIGGWFEAQPKKAYSEVELGRILNEYRDVWRLAQNTTVSKFIDDLVNSRIVRPIALKFSKGGDNANVVLEEKTRYLIGDADVFQLALSIVNKGYFSHYTAAYMNSLTTQIPKRIYVTTEQSKKTPGVVHIEQAAIDRAFQQPQRVSGEQAIWDDYTIIVLHGKYSNRAGVSNASDLPVTNIERTLIDLTVRPAYAGGVHAVLEAYRNALANISMNKMVAILTNLSFIYPYHQAIGFYLEKAGYPAKRLAYWELMEKPFDFYLTYEMKEMDYSQKWRLYYPKGM